MPISLERDYRLRWMDFDRYGRMKPQAILDIFQDVATIQAIDMGIDDSVLAKKGVFWVITRMKFEIVAAPTRLERVVAKTWPHTQTKLSFLRDFSMRSDGGELLVKATSEWCLMNRETRGFVSALESYDGPKDFCEERSFPEKPRKIKNFQEDTGGIVVTPGFSDIDQNGHVNNAMYAKLIADAVVLDERASMKTMQIDYRREIVAGTPVTIFTDQQADEIRVKGILESGDIAFMALMTLS